MLPARRPRRLVMVTRIVALLLAVLFGLVACTSAASRGNGAAFVADSGPLDAVVKRTFTTYGVPLRSGRVLTEMTVAYETYGRLAPDGRNAIVIAHGFTSSGHAAGKYSPNDRTAGWWDGLIGPGKAIDTNRYYVVASNMLGSSYGSTAPASVNPATGKPYGPDFPDITVRDIVGAQRLLLSALGPNWNGGWHYERGGIPETMTEIRYETLMRYGANELLAVTIPDPAQREARLREMAAAWAREFDPNSMVTLRKALDSYNTELQLRAIRAKVLYVLSRTD